MALGNYQKSVEYYEKALDSDKKFLNTARRIHHLRTAITMMALARFQALVGNHKKSIFLAQQALSVTRKNLLTQQQPTKVYTRESSFLMEFGFILLQAGQFPEAEKVLLDAICGNEFIRSNLGSKDPFKVSFFDIIREPFSLLEYIYTKEHKPEKALEITEQGRAR